MGFQLRKCARINIVNFQKVQSRLDSRPLITVEKCLTLSDMIGICSGDLVEVTVAIEVNVLGLRDRGFEPALISQARHSSPRI